MEKFRELGIIEPILESIREEGFEKPSEIQEKSIPLILAGKDVIAGSATGSGKTLAFASAIIKNVEKGRGIQALVLTPTRELAEQVAKTLKKFSKHRPLEIAAVYGGVSINPQIDKLKDAEVVVGTPGRMLDHLERKTIEFRNLKILVLDEADRMLDMGFIDDVERIIRECPVKRQTLLFSATISYEVESLASRYLRNPSKVFAEEYVDPAKLAQEYYDVADNLKFSLLFHFLRHEQAGLVMVFCNTRRNVDFVAKNLRLGGIDAIAIHGGFSQDKRNKVMSLFHSKKVTVLVCTDVAARGLDIKGVSHIYNYDIPKDSKEYVHRIGRTARAGKEGKVINILASRDYENFDRVSNNDNLNIIKKITPQVERVMIRISDGEGFRGMHRGMPRTGMHRSRGSFNREDRWDRSRGRDRGHSRYGGHSDSRRFNREGSEGGRRFGGGSREGKRFDGNSRGRFNRSSGGRFGGGNREGRRFNRSSRPRFNRSGRDNRRRFN